MRCELCGKYIEEGKKVKIEGSTVVTCNKCSSYGEVVEKVKMPQEKKKPPSPPTKKEISREELKIEKEEEVIEDFPEKIKKGRAKKDMKQEKLGKKINEPASLIRRMESGKFKPSPDLARKIEKALGIKLLKEYEEADFGDKGTSSKRELTLGDMVVVKKKEDK